MEALLLLLLLLFLAILLPLLLPPLPRPRDAQRRLLGGGEAASAVHPRLVGLGMVVLVIRVIR